MTRLEALAAMRKLLNAAEFYETVNSNLGHVKLDIGGITIVDVFITGELIGHCVGALEESLMKTPERL